MLTRRTFLNSSSSLLALCSVGGWSAGRAHAATRPRGNRPPQPFDATANRQFVTPLTNPLDPTFPGIRRPAANTAATVTIKESTLSLGLNSPNGKPLVTRVWGYGLGEAATVSIPGPTFEVTRGRPLTVTYVNGLDGVPNRMPVDTTLEWADPGALGGLAPVPLVTHLHGARSETRSDGLPEGWFTPNDEFTGRLFAKPYQYENEQEAAHLWYHDHVLGITRLNIYMGLAGFYFIRDANEDRLRATNVLPSFPYEIPLMLLDRLFDRNGQLFYPSEDPGNPDLPSPTHLPEFFGDVILVNGQAWPVQTVEQRKYRFRVLNASDSRFYAIKFQRQSNPASGPSSPVGPTLPILVVGTELGLLNKPAKARWQTPPLPDGSGGISQDDTLLIGPGERYDVVVDFSDVPTGTRLLLWNGAATPFTGQPPDGVDYVAPTPGLTDRVMAFDVVSRNSSIRDATVALETPLRAFQTAPLSAVSTDGVQRRQILMYEGTDSFGRLQTMLGTLDQGTLVYSDPITEQPRAGTSEIWEFHNTTADAHPIHMHLVDFRIINRQDFAIATLDKTNSDGSTGATVASAPQFLGSPVAPPAYEAGKKDTMVAYPGQVTRVRASFSRPGEFVYHCHILSHEDHEMMRRYEVLPPTA